MTKRVAQNNIGIKVPEESQGSDFGLKSHPSAEFLDIPLKHAIDELPQNSGDEIDDIRKPVKITIKYKKIKTKDLPCIKELSQKYDDCINYAKQKKFQNDNGISSKQHEIEFFESAKKELQGDHTCILQFSEENTKGVPGSMNDEGSKFYALTIAQGSNVKSDETAGGSAGTGKNCIYALSNLKLAFYSSLSASTKDSSKLEFSFLGSGVLISHTEIKNPDTKLSSRAFICNASSEKLLEIKKQDDLPPFLKRDKKGLTTTIVSPDIDNKWTQKCIIYALERFNKGFAKGTLKITLIDDNNKITKEINQSNYQEFFKQKEIQDCVNLLGRNKEWEETASIVRLINNDKTSVEVFKDQDLGTFKLSISSIDNKDPKKVIIIRKNMRITDNLENFGFSLKQWNEHNPFIATLEPTDKTAQKIIRKLENARHNSLVPSNISNKEERDLVISKIKKLHAWLRKKIGKYAKNEVLEKKSVNELKKYFPSTNDVSSGANGNESNTSKLEIKEINQKSLRRRIPFKKKIIKTKKKIKTNPIPIPPIIPSSNTKNTTKTYFLPSFKSISVGNDLKKRKVFFELLEKGDVEIKPLQIDRNNVQHDTKIHSATKPWTVINNTSVKHRNLNVGKNSVEITFDNSLALVDFEIEFSTTIFNSK